MSMDIHIQKAKQIIAENIYCTIATATKDGIPWISPVFFAYDDDYALYWVSNKDSRHSQNLKRNPQAAIVIFNSQAPEGSGDGVYMEAAVQELEDTDTIAHALDVLNKRVTKDEFRVKRLGDVTKQGVWRVYMASPRIISKLSEGEWINGQYIDTRIELPLQ